MPALENTRHERYAQELAKGKSQTEAYEAAGYKLSRSAAARLSADVNICARVAELAERVAQRTEITAEQITARLMRIADVAEKTGITLGETGEPTESSSRHLSVARAALIDVAKINGHIVDRQAHGGDPNAPPIKTEGSLDVSGLTPDQLRVLASVRLRSDG